MHGIGLLATVATQLPTPFQLSNFSLKEWIQPDDVINSHPRLQLATHEHSNAHNSGNGCIEFKLGGRM